MLAVSQSNSGASTLSLDLPKALSIRVQNALKADPKTLDLRQQAQHFYTLGCRMLELFDEEELGDILDDVRSSVLNKILCLQLMKSRPSREEPRRLMIRPATNGVY